MKGKIPTTIYLINAVMVIGTCILSVQISERASPLMFLMLHSILIILNSVLYFLFWILKNDLFKGYRLSTIILILLLPIIFLILIRASFTELSSN
jgi:hypothetical protein